MNKLGSLGTFTVAPDKPSCLCVPSSWQERPFFQWVPQPTTLLYADETSDPCTVKFLNCNNLGGPGVESDIACSQGKRIWEISTFSNEDDLWL